VGCACRKAKAVGYRAGDATGWIAVTDDGGCALPIGDRCCRVFDSEESARNAAETAEITNVSFRSVML